MSAADLRVARSYRCGWSIGYTDGASGRDRSKRYTDRSPIWRRGHEDGLCRALAVGDSRIFIMVDGFPRIFLTEYSL